MKYFIQILTLLSIFFISFTNSIQAYGNNNLLHQCWSPKELKAKSSERYPRHGIKRAFVAPPKIEYPKNSPIPKNLQGAIRYVKLPPGKKLIALTLDLCETSREVSGYDGKIIDYLRKHNIKTTFFTGGKWFLTHKERAAQLLADPLFEIGSHAWTHGNFRHINNIKMKHEIGYAQAAYHQTRTNLLSRACAIPARTSNNIPEQMSLFRFPFGSCTAKALKTVAQNGQLAIQWDVSTGDPSKSQTSRGIANQVLRRVKPGSIIIAHANGRGWNTAKALPLFIPQLKAKGYEFVTVSELLKAGEPVISQYCYDSVRGDTNHYGRPRKKRQQKAKSRRKQDIWQTSTNLWND